MLRVWRDSYVSNVGQRWKCGETQVGCDRKKDKNMLLQNLTENSIVSFEKKTQICEIKSSDLKPDIR